MVVPCCSTPPRASPTTMDVRSTVLTTVLDVNAHYESGGVGATATATNSSQVAEVLRAHPEKYSTLCFLQPCCAHRFSTIQPPKPRLTTTGPTDTVSSSSCCNPIILTPSVFLTNLSRCVRIPPMLPAIPVPSKPLRQPMHPFRDIVNTTPIRQREGTGSTSTSANEPISCGGDTASLAPGRPDGSPGAPSPNFLCPCGVHCALAIRRQRQPRSPLPLWLMRLGKRSGETTLASGI